MLHLRESESYTLLYSPVHINIAKKGNEYYEKNWNCFNLY
nr:MAG TPA: hypothetical protein [Caudoviricetes sp.]